MGFLDMVTKTYGNLRGMVEIPVTKPIEYGHLETPSGQYQQPQEPLYDQSILSKAVASQKSKAYLEDPMGLADATGYKDRPFSMSYDILRRMASKDAVIASIMNTRVNQVSNFTTPARFSRSGVGYEIRLRDPEEEVTDEDKDVMVSIEKFLENTGYDNDNDRDDFDTFVRKITRDRLTFDQVAIETVPDRKGRIAEFYAVDAATIRVAANNLKDPTAVGNSKQKIKYVQILNNEIQATFTKDELGFAVANPRSDISVAPYGFSELEMLIHQVTAHLWAEEYNSRFFSQGGTTKGILNIKGMANTPTDEAQLESFKRQWRSQVSGMTGAWKTPVLSVDGLEYIDVSQTNREMEFEKWMNYLINVACAVYQIDPSEINFPNRGGATGSGGGGLGDGGIKDRLTHSKDKGLRPLLRFLETVINKFIVSKFGERYVFVFVGIDSKSDMDMVNLKKAQGETYKTLNELRTEDGLEPIENGDVVLNPAYINYIQSLSSTSPESTELTSDQIEDRKDKVEDDKDEKNNPKQSEPEVEDEEVSEEDVDEGEVEDKDVSKNVKYIRISLD